MFGCFVVGRQRVCDRCAPKSIPPPLNINDIIVNSSVDISSGSIPVEESPKNLGNNKQAQFVSEHVLLPADDQMVFIGVNEFNLNINDIIVNSITIALYNSIIEIALR